MFKNQKLGVKLISSFITIAALTLILGSLAIFNMLKVKQTATILAQQNVPSVDVANEVERSSLRTMYETRGYAYSEDKQFLDKARLELAEVKRFLKDANTHADLHHLKGLGDNARLATDKATAYEQLLNDTVKATEAMDKEKRDSFVAATAFMKACTDFLASQAKQIDGEFGTATTGKLTADKLRERQKKITLCNDIIDLGNTIRLGTWQAIAQRDPVLFKDTMKKFTDVNAKLDELKPITFDEADIRQITDCRAAGQAYLGNMERFLANWYAREELNTKRGTAGNEVLSAAENTAKAGMKDTVGAASAAASSLATSSTVMIVGCIVCVVLGLGLGIVVTRSITQPILRVAETLAAGAEQTASAAALIASSSQSLAEGASEQAASLEETSASLEEITSMVRRNAEAAAKAKELAGQTRQAADTGTTDMVEMESAMNDIRASSAEVAKIVKDIDEIAFQTNILALNAAVEAARAGEAGMGFAVVADEVRNLAQRSAKSAKETALKIEDAISKSERGVQISTRVAVSFTQIAGKTRDVDQLVAEIALASNEQSQGIQQVSVAVSQMDKITQSNAATAEEAASASEELNSQAVSVSQTVAELEKLVGSAKTSHNVAPSPTHRPPAPRADKSAAKPRKSGHVPAATATRPVAPGTNGHAARATALALPGEDDFKDF